MGPYVLHRVFFTLSASKEPTLSSHVLHVLACVLYGFFRCSLCFWNPPGKIFPISVYLMVRPTQQPQHNMTLPRVLGGPSDCQSATVAAREGLAASESWH